MCIEEHPKSGRSSVDKGWEGKRPPTVIKRGRPSSSIEAVQTEDVDEEYISEEYRGRRKHTTHFDKGIQWKLNA